MFKMFVTGDSINASDRLSVKRHLSGLNIRPATLKTRLLVISKLLTIYFSNCGLRCFQLCDCFWLVCKCSIAFCSYSFEMNSGANIAAHLSIGPKVNGQQNLTGFFCFFYQYP